MENETTVCQAEEYEQVLRQDGLALLVINARWPRFPGEGAGQRRLERYYRSLARQWMDRWTGPLLERAKAAPAQTLPWKVRFDHLVTYSRDGLFSLRWEVWEDVGQRRKRRIRRGDVWRLPAGDVVTLRELLPPGRRWKRQALEQVRQQIQGRLDSGESVFFPDWPKRMVRRFSPGRFYLTDNGVAVFYPVGSIAPAMEEFPTFSLKEKA